jgi:CRISPR-associated protein Cas5t
MDTKPVLRIEMAGTVTSFRYPHFTQGYQPTFELPPPSTIYGHICSAVGELIEPQNWQFGYHFTHSGKFVDYKEHLHFDDPIQPFPFDRELLFNPHLVLYVTKLDLLEAFRRPQYSVILGRSQDLMTYLSVEPIELVRAERAYFEHTLLPLELGPRLNKTIIAVTMPRYVDSRRRVQWGVYGMLLDTALYPPPVPSLPEWDDQDVGLQFEGDTFELWVDPDIAHRRDPTLKRAVWLHSIAEESL